MEFLRYQIKVQKTKIKPIKIQKIFNRPTPRNFKKYKKYKNL